MARAVLGVSTMLPVTDEETWMNFLRDVAAWQPPIAKRTLLIAPHPDDEVLGAGGLIAMQRQGGATVVVIAVTDGEAAYGKDDHLAGIRRAEQEAALAELNVGVEDMIRLRFPDSAVTQNEEQLSRNFQLLVQPGDLVIAPWCLDPHPDHEACGRAARSAAQYRGVPLVSYFFWAWHRNKVDSLVGTPLVRLFLNEGYRTQKARALAHYKSQLEHESGSPILPEVLLAPARRAFETFIYHG